MAADRTDKGPDNPGGESFKRSMDELSRRLAERMAQKATSPAAAAAARRTALQAYDRARARRLRVALGFTLGALAGSALVILVPTIGAGPAPAFHDDAANDKPVPPVQSARAAPAPAEPASPTPASPGPEAIVTSSSPPGAAGASAQLAPLPPESVAPGLPLSEAVIASASGAAAADTALQPAPVQPTPLQQAPLQQASVESAPLRRSEVREIQARLSAFGFNAGPADGIAGVVTEDAVMSYQRHHGQRQTGKADRDLLEQLRRDPAPQVAPLQLAPPPPAPSQVAGRTPQPATRSPDPFEPVRVEFERFGRWLNSLGR